MAVLTDFVKEFDRLPIQDSSYEAPQILDSPRWITSCLTNGKHFVSIDDKASETINIAFGIPTRFHFGARTIQSVRE